jgi:hypothetical protein
MSNLVIPQEIIERKIYLIRGKKVMLDQDLANLYGVANKALIQAVKRNQERFPEDFMFQLNKDEFKVLRSQIVTSSWGGRRYLPYAFTEQGVAMLSSVLRSKRAIMVNIHIMRVFVRLREILASHEDLRKKIEAMERKYDQKFQVVFKAIRALIDKPNKRIGKIGFLADRNDVAKV